MKKSTVLLLLFSLLLLCGCTGSGRTESAAPPADSAGEAEIAADCPLPDGRYTAEFQALTIPFSHSIAEGLADGVYVVDVDTDSSMFHVNEALDGKGILTVENGHMTIHVTLASTSILKLFPGKAEDARTDGAVLLEPSEDTVDYHDGTTDVAFGFDVPVPALDTDFDLALIGKKGVWYDHVVSVSNPEPLQ